MSYIAKQLLFALPLTALLIVPEVYFTWSEPSYQASLLSNAKTLAMMFIIFWLIASGSWRPLNVTMIVILFLAQGGEMSFFRYFARFCTPNDFYMLFVEFEDATLAVRNELFYLSIPLLINLLCMSIALVLYGKMHGSTTRSAIPSSILALLLALLFIPPIKGKPFEANLYYTSARNGLNMLSHFLVNEVAYRVSTENRGIYVKNYLPYKLIKRNVGTKPHVVIVMGESINPRHMSLLGYKRSTTPFLDTLFANPEELHFKTIAFASGVNTRTSVPLFFNMVEEPHNLKQLQVMQTNLFRLAKEEGYHTTYLSTQKSGVLSAFFPMGSMDVWMDVREVAPRSHQSGDRRLLDVLQQLNLDGSHPNFIVLHQRNIHAPYEDNYPKTFVTFRSKGKDRNKVMIDNYDNGMIYQDDFLKSLISQLKRWTDRPTMVIYTADHNELLGENGLWGHGNLDKISAEVPLLVFFFNDRDRHFYNDWKNHISCYPTQYQVAHQVSSYFGIDVVNPQERNSRFSVSVNQALPGYAKNKVLEFSIPEKVNCDKSLFAATLKN